MLQFFQIFSCRLIRSWEEHWHPFRLWRDERAHRHHRGAPLPLPDSSQDKVGAEEVQGAILRRRGDATEAVPAFLTMLVMPLTFWIAVGLAFGLIFYPILKLPAGWGREIPPLVYLLELL